MALKETRKLTKLGKHSYYVVLPVYMVRHLKWRERQKLEVSLDGDKIMIKDWGSKSIKTKQ